MKLFKGTNLKIGDLAAFLAAGALIGVLSFQIYGNRNDDPYLYISNGGQYWVYPLEEDREITVPGRIGDTSVKIEGGKAWVIDSPCPDKICVNAWPLEREGDWTACLPNQIFLSLTGGGLEELVDEFSY
ncbi:MAG: NusG domain II-containing protein [Spirochaetales bacterium]|jgi:hypothetical protein|nr:NusG domain II-containing protein [Spirochaetales bacterium]